MTEAKIELSIIIVSYNTAPITKNCLDSIKKSLANSKINWEIIVVDNASTDKSLQMLETVKQTYIKNMQLVINNKNVGFAKANNQAAQTARGKYLLFLNSDTIVLDEAIETLLNFYKQNEEKNHFLGGKLLNKDLTPQASCGPFYTLPVVFGALFLKGDYWGLTRYSPNTVCEVDWISGACILTKKEYFKKVGGFDEKIFMYMDEIDLLFRAKKKGYRVFFYPEAKFIHLASASSAGRTYPILQVYRGFIYFYKKHHSVLTNNLLKFMLKLKALVSIFLGRIAGNQYLTKTYGEAYQIVKDA